MHIDSHQHFWQYNPTDYGWMSEAHHVIRRDFLPEHLKPLLDAAGVSGTFAVQARQTLGETDFLLELASRFDWIRGVVGWVPLCDPRVEQHLEHYSAYDKLIGFRHVLQDEPDDRFMLRDDFNNGIRALGRFDFRYDVLIFEKHLPHAIDFVDRHPNQPMVLDHIAKPRISAQEFDQAWANNIKKLGEREHVFCKLSGMVTEVRDAEWDLELIKPYFEVALESFGPRRLMFGSDWPVCLLCTDYSNWVDTVNILISSLTSAEQHDIMGGNAVRFYTTN